MSESRTSIDGDKYIVVHTNGADLHVLRHGERWLTQSEMVGSKMVLSAAQEIDDLRSRVSALEAALKDAVPYICGAYECAFPDEAKNIRILEAAKAALKQGENK